MSSTVYRAAIVGCGRVGCLLDDDPKRRGIWTHAGAYRACDRTRLVALADRDPQALDRAGRRWGIQRLYSDLESMLRSEEIDILSVCTPSDSHASRVREAAEAGVRAVWCEKPMAVTPAEAADLASLEDRLMIAVNHVRRWDRCYQRAKQFLEEGHLGRPLRVTAWYTHGISNMGSHLMDTLRTLCGEPRWVWAAPDESGAADPTLSGLIGFEGDLLCQVVGCGSEFLLFEVDLIGSRGRMRASSNGSRLETWRWETSSRYSDYQELASPEVLWEGQDEGRMLRAVEDIVRCLDEGGRPRCNAQDGLRSVELVCAFLQSARTGNRVHLPLEKESRGLAIPVR